LVFVRGELDVQIGRYTGDVVIHQEYAPLVTFSYLFFLLLGNILGIIQMFRTYIGIIIVLRDIVYVNMRKDMVMGKKYFRSTFRGETCTHLPVLWGGITFNQTRGE
jgi:hypothetical protein